MSRNNLVYTWGGYYQPNIQYMYTKFIITTKAYYTNIITDEDQTHEG